MLLRRSCTVRCLCSGTACRRESAIACGEHTCFVGAIGEGRCVCAIGWRSGLLPRRVLAAHRSDRRALADSQTRRRLWRCVLCARHGGRHLGPQGGIHGAGELDDLRLHILDGGSHGCTRVDPVTRHVGRSPRRGDREYRSEPAGVVLAEPSSTVTWFQVLEKCIIQGAIAWCMSAMVSASDVNTWIRGYVELSTNHLGRQTAFGRRMTLRGRFSSFDDFETLSRFRSCMTNIRGCLTKRS